MLGVERPNCQKCGLASSASSLTTWTSWRSTLSPLTFFWNKATRRPESGEENQSGNVFSHQRYIYKCTPLQIWNVWGSLKTDWCATASKSPRSEPGFLTGPLPSMMDPNSTSAGSFQNCPVLKRRSTSVWENVRRNKPLSLQKSSGCNTRRFCEKKAPSVANSRWLTRSQLPTKQLFSMRSMPQSPKASELQCKEYPRLFCRYSRRKELWRRSRRRETSLSSRRMQSRVWSGRWSHRTPILTRPRWCNSRCFNSPTKRYPSLESRRSWARTLIWVTPVSRKFRCSAILSTIWSWGKDLLSKCWHWRRRRPSL